MSDLAQMKCPGCGGAMVFDAELQKMKCPYCDTVVEVEKFQPTEVSKKKKSVRTRTHAEEWGEGEQAGMSVYTCQSCGGQIVVEDTLGATKCPFCDNQLVMTEQFSGDLKPETMIPFQITKEQAVEIYKKSLKKKFCLPPAYRSKKKIDEIKGVYVPFWLFDFDVDADYVFDAENTSETRRDDTIKIKKDIYQVYRTGTLSFAKLPVDGSEKMDNTVMENIEPYDLSQAVPFNRAYLSGFLANRYDVTMGTAKTTAVRRAKASTEEAFRKTADYGKVEVCGKTVELTKSEATYALYPVWLLTMQWKGTPQLFAINGQTGKLTGEYPVDGKMMLLWILTRGLALAAILILINFLRWWF